MGFSCGLYKVKKFNNLTLPQIQIIESYYSYNENDWAKQNYESWQEYCIGQDKGDPSTICAADIEAYKNEYIQHEGDYSKSLDLTYDSWCSNGKYFHDWFMENGQEIDNYSAVLDQDTIIKAIDYCADTLQLMQFKLVKVEYAFKEDPETEIITSIPCTGIETLDEEGNLKRVYSDSFEYSDLYIPIDNYFDTYKYDAFSRLLKALIKILATTDFKNEIVYYNGG